MKLDKTNILSPNSEFERRQELSKLLSQNGDLSENDGNILKSCMTENHESIGMLGCLINDNSNINNARLIIGSLNQSNTELAKKSNGIINCSETQFNNLIDKLSKRFILNTEEISKYEDKIYSILFGILSDRN